MKILIATPVGQGRVTVQYMHAIRDLEAAVRLQRPTIELELLTIGGSYLPRIRNMMASVVWSDPTFTHIFFVDDDMAFAPSAFFKLLDFDADVVGHLCQTREMAFDAHYEVARRVPDNALVRSIAQPYASADKFPMRRVGENLQYIRRGEFIRTFRIGAAVTLIRRSALMKMADACPDLIRPVSKDFEGLGLKGSLLQAYAPITTNSVALSEDLSFCYRWTELCGGEIWACTDEPIGHVGTVEYRGRFADRARFQQENGGPIFD